MGVRDKRVIFHDDNYVGDRFGLPIAWKMEWERPRVGDRLYSGGYTWQVVHTGLPDQEAALWRVHVVGWPAAETPRPPSTKQAFRLS